MIFWPRINGQWLFLINLLTLISIIFLSNKKPNPLRIIWTEKQTLPISLRPEQMIKIRWYLIHQKNFKNTGTGQEKKLLAPEKKKWKFGSKKGKKYQVLIVLWDLFLKVSLSDPQSMFSYRYQYNWNTFGSVQEVVIFCHKIWVRRVERLCPCNKFSWYLLGKDVGLFFCIIMERNSLSFMRQYFLLVGLSNVINYKL